MPHPKSTTARNRVFVGNCCQIDAQRVASTASLTLSRHSCNLQRACRRVDYGEPMSQPPAAASPLNTRLYNLEYPRSLGVYSTYQERSEEHTSELQSRGHLVCRLLLE